MWKLVSFEKAEAFTEYLNENKVKPSDIVRFGDIFPTIGKKEVAFAIFTEDRKPKKAKE